MHVSTLTTYQTLRHFIVVLTQLYSFRFGKSYQMFPLSVVKHYVRRISHHFCLYRRIQRDFFKVAFCYYLFIEHRIKHGFCYRRYSRVCKSIAPARHAQRVYRHLVLEVIHSAKVLPVRISHTLKTSSSDMS